MGSQRSRAITAAAVIGMISLTSACAGDDSTGDSTMVVDLAFEWTCGGDWVLAYLAQEKGYFTDENLDVRYVRGEGGSGTLPLVASGERDIAEISAPPVVLGAAEDLPVTVVGVMATQSPVVLFADGSITTPQDLQGKRVAVQTGEFEGGVWDAFVAKTGLDPSQIEVVPATGTSNVVFIDHQVDAFISFYLDPATVSLTDGRNGEETLFFMRDYVPTYGHTIVVNDDYLRENGDAVRGFNTAWANAMKYATEHRDEALDLLASNCPELDAPSAEFSLDAYIDSWNDEYHRQNGYLTFDAKGFEETARVLVDGGLLDEAAAGSVQMSTDYLPDPPIKP
jgi:NitT/TauT family transport system substrate-binding protein